jgi:hypothetical protein
MNGSADGQNGDDEQDEPAAAPAPEDDHTAYEPLELTQLIESDPSD